MHALRPASFRWRLVVAAVALSCAVLGLSSAASTRGPAPAACTHGASSIGPITIVNGRVTGDTTPRTSGCIPR